MRLHADARRKIEAALRIVLIAVLAISLAQALRSRAGADSSRISLSAFDKDLARTLGVGAAREINVTVDRAPTRVERDLLLALRRSGAALSWRGDIPAVAIEVTREREPFADGRITAIGEMNSLLAVADSAGPLDSLHAAGGATMEVGTLVGTVRASSGAFAARAGVPSPTSRRAVLVLGRVSWEGKFVSSALAESGWIVRASSPAAPTVVVHDDAILPIDTARYDAIVALDSTAADFAPGIVKFVAQGGGLIAVGSALQLPALRGIVPASASEREAGRILLAEDTVTTRDLPTRALANVRNDAVILTREPKGVMIAAHRVGLGRALAVGYDETWRWRMLGGESGLALHREWWSHTVGTVAPARDSTSRAGDGDAAPRAAMIDAFGLPDPKEFKTSAIASSNPLPFIFLVLVVSAMLVEVASRRFRGVK